jgi:hypothetical protein
MPMSGGRRPFPLCVDCGAPVSSPKVARCRRCAGAQQRGVVRQEYRRQPNAVRVEDGVAYLQMTDRWGEPTMEAMVDAVDLERVARWRWSISGGSVRASETVGGRMRQHYLHRTVLQLGEDDRRRVRHLNGDRCDNRRANLVVVLRDDTAKA